MKLILINSADSRFLFFPCVVIMNLLVKKKFHEMKIIETKLKYTCTVLVNYLPR